MCDGSVWVTLQEIEMSFDKSDCTRYCRKAKGRRAQAQAEAITGTAGVPTYKWCYGPGEMSAKLIAEQANEESQSDSQLIYVSD